MVLRNALLQIDDHRRHHHRHHHYHPLLHTKIATHISLTFPGIWTCLSPQNGAATIFDFENWAGLYIYRSGPSPCWGATAILYQVIVRTFAHI